MRGVHVRHGAGVIVRRKYTVMKCPDCGSPPGVAVAPAPCVPEQCAFDNDRGVLVDLVRGAIFCTKR